MHYLNRIQRHQQSNHEDGCCSNNHTSTSTESTATSWLQRYASVLFSLVVLVTGLALEHIWKVAFFTETVRFFWYLIAYLPVGLPVLKEAVTSLSRKDLFNEFFLMTLATLGAFYIGEYPEGVAVMLFYTFGELLQDDAVRRSKANIRALLDIRPKHATILVNNHSSEVPASEVAIGTTIIVKPGEKLALDGELLSQTASFNTAAITGESKPITLNKGETALAGSIALDTLVQVRATKQFQDSAVSKIIDLAQNALSQKAPTEKYIRRFAKIYTPIVVLLAVLIILVPYGYSFTTGESYNFDEWLYRSLIFLVISCPCALVVSIPLGYFGGIGAASRNGILVKGSNYLDLLAKTKTVVTDKTGTITKGLFEVQGVYSENMPIEQLLSYAASLEMGSTHPIAKAVVQHTEQLAIPLHTVSNVTELSGRGMTGEINQQTIAIGNARLMNELGITTNHLAIPIETAALFVAVDEQLAGHITIADSLKDDTLLAIQQLHQVGIERIVMVSGDQNNIVQAVAKQAGIQEAHGNCMPADKITIVRQIKQTTKTPVVFVGDGINDAPVLAMSDVGIAMGTLGSDAAIEMADVIIQSDQPSRIPIAIAIGRQTQKIVLQNISLAFGVKFVVLLLGAGGLATLWEAVFADVGVALLAILNAIRIQKMNFNLNGK